LEIRPSSRGRIGKPSYSKSTPAGSLLDNKEKHLARQQTGNGSGKVNVITQNVGGCVLPPDLPMHLSHALTQGFRQYLEYVFPDQLTGGQ
jgi:hypothetical protein